MKIKLVFASILSMLLPSGVAAQPFQEVVYSPEKTVFTLFAPNDAKQVVVRIYDEGLSGKAKGTDNWFVGGKCDENGHQTTLKLDFLDKGRKYDCTIYADAKDAHYETNPQAYTITKKVVTAKDVLKLTEAPGGGFAISLIAQ